MRYNFINVFTKEDKEKLLLAGYILIKSDDIKQIYVFRNDGNINGNFSATDSIHKNIVMTNTMTF